MNNNVAPKAERYLVWQDVLCIKVLGVFKKRKKRKYNSDFQLRAIKLCLETDKPDAQIAKCLGIDQQTIHNHLGKMPVLANLLNADLYQDYTVSQVAQKHGWTNPRSTRHTTHLDGFPSKVTITKNLHPLQGRSLDVLGWLHKNKILYLTLVLPDSTRSFIPAAWTNLGELCPEKFKSSKNQAATNLIASTSSLLQVRKIVDVLLVKRYPLKQKSETALKEEYNRAKTNGILARSRGTATNSRNLEKSQSSTAEKNHNRSIPSCQQVRLPGENKSNQGDKS